MKLIANQPAEPKLRTVDRRRMTGATICSGIGSPETAMPWVNWSWSAEVEKFPSAVLTARHPQSVNLGDITQPDFIERAVAHGPLDILVAGTPCQAFSVAGNRQSLDDARGNLTLRFVEIVNAIDPRSVLWENVPGVLSTKDNAFGCFLGALAGSGTALVPACGQRWTDAGVVDGPRRRITWRVLDAQWFGLAQRRERVFVVASLRDGPHPAEILFEREGVQRHSAPSRKTREDITVTFGARTSGGGGFGTEFDLGGGYELSPALTASGRGVERPGDSRGQDCVIPILEAGARTGNSTNDPRAGIGGGDPGDPMYTLQSGKQHAVFAGELSPTLCGSGNRTGGDRPPGTQVETAESLIVASTGDVYGHDNALVAFSCKDSGADASEISPTLRAMEFDGSHANGGGKVAVALAIRGRDGTPQIEMGGEISNAILTPNGGRGGIGVGAVMRGMAVRRLTPMECERLQGFPDRYTAIDFRGKPAADGPRYKALGNSMAVPVVRWIGERIRAVLDE